MLKPLDIITQFIVIICMLLVSHGYDECSCSCTLINYGVKDICTTVARATKKSDNNEEEIKKLRDSYHKEILPFIRKSTRQPTNEGNSRMKPDQSNSKIETLKNEPTVDLWKEIQKLKNEQRSLEEKVEKLEKYCLEKTDELLGNMKKSETRTLEVKDELLGKVTMAENRTLKLERELSEEITKEKYRNLETKTELLRRINEAENRALKTEKTLSGEIKKEENRTSEMKASLSGRIIEVQNLCLKFDREMSEKINESVNQILILRNTALPRLKEVEAQTSNMKHAFSAKVRDAENIILKVKKEVLGKENEVANLTSELKDEFVKKVNEVEENTSKKINELVMQVEKEGSALNSQLKAEQTTRGHLQKILNETRDKLRDMEVNQNETAITLREEINSKGKDLEVYVYENFMKNVYQRLYALEKESYRGNKALGDLRAKLENYTQVGNHDVNLYKEVFDILFDTFQAVDQQVLPTAKEFEEKSAHLEEVFRRLFSKYFSTTLTSNVTWFRIETMQSDQQKMFSNLTGSITHIQNEVKQCCPEDNISRLNGAETTSH